MNVRFGTDGVRGVAGSHPITAEVALALGRAVAQWSTGAIIVARDPRPSGSALAAAVIAGAASAGAEVLDAGLAPTPAVGCALAEGLGEAGIVVTASHNAWPDNGFKVLGPGGRKPTPAEVRQLEELVAEAAAEATLGTVRRAPEVVDRWLARQEVPASLHGCAIALDLANGAGAVARQWLETTGIDWTVVGESGLPNDRCGSENLEVLGEAVRQGGCAFGVALDGDGDRCRIVDERGLPVPGDAVTWLLARHLGVSALAVTVMSNAALEASLPGVKVLRTPVGDKHLQRALAAGEVSLGAEESGHILFADHPAGDGLFAGLRVAAALTEAGRASSVFAGFEPLPRQTVKVPVQSRPALETLPELSRACREAESTLGTGGRVFLRYSGTEPVLRILVEGQTEGLVSAAVERVEAAARETLG